MEDGRTTAKDGGGSTWMFSTTNPNAHHSKAINAGRAHHRPWMAEDLHGCFQPPIPVAHISQAINAGRAHHNLYKNGALGSPYNTITGLLVMPRTPTMLRFSVCHQYDKLSGR